MDMESRDEISSHSIVESTMLHMSRRDGNLIENESCREQIQIYAFKKPAWNKQLDRAKSFDIPYKD